MASRARSLALMPISAANAASSCRRSGASRISNRSLMPGKLRQPSGRATHQTGGSGVARDASGHGLFDSSPQAPALSHLGGRWQAVRAERYYLVESLS